MTHPTDAAIAQANELMACPFCGRAGKLSARPASNSDGGGYIAFAACYCGGFSATAHQTGKGTTEADAKRDAIYAWNRRTPARALDAEKGGEKEDGPGSNTGHGHVWPRPDGGKARCGGPGLCSPCSADAARYPTTPPAQAAEAVEMVGWIREDGFLPVSDTDAATVGEFLAGGFKPVGIMSPEQMSAAIAAMQAGEGK